MKYPEFLKENGCIGLVAPSFGCNIEPYRSSFENALKKWRERGCRCDLGPNCREGAGIGISNTPEKCGAELTEYYLRKENDCLISCGGGELMCEILEYVDFEAIKKAAPKWFMGYSDNTNMTFLLTTLCDVACVYGPCAPAFGMEPWHPAIADAMELLEGKRRAVESYGLWEQERGAFESAHPQAAGAPCDGQGYKDEEHPLLPYFCTQQLMLRAFLPGGGAQREEYVQKDAAVMKGRLLGGCMDCLVNLLGTRFDQVRAFTQRYRQDGFIWFLESCDLNVFGIRRAMWQMDQAGWFEHVKGFLIGRPYCHGQEMMGLDQYQAVLETAKRHGVPVIMDADLGHLPPMMPLVSGSMAEIVMENNRLRITMDYV